MSGYWKYVVKLVGNDGKVIAKLTVGENEHEPLAQALRERLGSNHKEQPRQVKRRDL